MFLLDSNVCIRLLKGTSRAAATRLGRESPAHIQLCSVVKAELLFGARHSRRTAENLRLLERFFAPFDSLSFDDSAAQHYGWIRAELQRAGQMIGPNDLMIAAIARAHDLTLVTHNISEFQRVLGLRLEDWEGIDRGTQCISSRMRCDNFERM